MKAVRGGGWSGRRRGVAGPVTGSNCSPTPLAPQAFQMPITLSVSANCVHTRSCVFAAPAAGSFGSFSDRKQNRPKNDRLLRL